jgi:putative membrane protein
MAENGRSIGAGVIAGAIGGLAAAWVMNVFMEAAGEGIQKAAARLDGAAKRQEMEQSRPQNEAGHEEPKEDATMKAADAVVSAITGGRHLTLKGRQAGGPIVHYAFGALMGALYGLTAEAMPMAKAGFGTAFGGALFAGADLWAVPALGLSGSSENSVSSLATPLSAHLVYGVTTEGVRRLVRAVV